jgi:hypothetical protein
MGGESPVDLAPIDARQAQKALGEGAFISGASGGHGTTIF